MNRLRIAIQRKGRLAGQSRDLLASVGIVGQAGPDELIVTTPFGVDLLLVRDDDIPGLLAGGFADAGILGANVLLEQGLDPRCPDLGALNTLAELGWGECTLRIAVPNDMPYAGPADLAGLRIATTYPALTRQWLDAQGVQAEILELTGSVEIAPALGQAEVVCDLVSTGRTLAANGLRPVDVVLESQAVLVSRVPVRASVAARLSALTATIVAASADAEAVPA